MSNWEDLQAEFESCARRGREQYEELSRITGKSIAGLEADVTAPDPRARGLEEVLCSS